MLEKSSTFAQVENLQNKVKTSTPEITDIDKQKQKPNTNSV